ncbi:MAG: TetR/AcrR family transcriptional regulator [Cytophagales bacterium]|nr:MAG: TetR/AcrR family transcriptional regulator [Cytophagales bacterium]
MPLQKITKEELLQKAAQVINTQGYKSTSMHDLAKACGLLKGSFYHYFSSKEILVKEVLSFSLAFFREHVFAKAYQEAYTPEQRLAKMLTLQADIVSQNFQGCLFGNLTLETDHLETEFKEIIRLFFEEWQSAMAHLWFLKTQDLTSAQQQAQLSIAHIEGGILLMKLHRDKEPFNQVLTYINHSFQNAKS